MYCNYISRRSTLQLSGRCRVTIAGDACEKFHSESTTITRIDRVVVRLLASFRETRRSVNERQPT